MHADEIKVTTALATRLVDKEMPDWAGQPVRPLAATGTDNWMFRIARDKILRMPRRPMAVANLRREWEWLPHLTGLPLTIPEPLAWGEPSSIFPNPWMVLRWQPGETLATFPPADPGAAAQSLGGFVRAMAALPGGAGPIAGSANNNRGVPLAQLDETTRRSIAAIARRYPSAPLLAIWENALSAHLWHGAPLWLHGDLAPSNLLGQEGHLSGVIDFGLMARGDPAVDLMPGWTVFDGAARTAFFAATGHDGDTLQRARGWALYNAVINLSYYGDTHPFLSRLAHHVLQTLLSEAAGSS
ncbi:MAG: aminoglycoside phosphotransferase family protein [Pseudomonadota bacterium]